uniref:GS beta-grasp domain-containing protein n=1 Tax=Panagrolaimus sp. JU765 TaxID=591449 RepID=A0AC34RNR0_9BILA
MIGAAVIDQFLGPHPTKCQATYIWIDGTGEIIRSKTRTIDPIPLNINEYPIWNYDGSSCGQSHGLNSDLYLKPVAHYPDPFLGGRNCLLLCETLNHRNEPTSKLFYPKN